MGLYGETEIIVSLVSIRYDTEYVPTYTVFMDEMRPLAYCLEIRMNLTLSIDERLLKLDFPAFSRLNLVNTFPPGPPGCRHGPWCREGEL